MSSPQSNANGPQGIDYLPVRNGNALKYLRVKADGIGLEWVTVSSGGESNTSSNVGTGEGLAKAKVGVDLPFKSLLGQTNKIVLTGNTDDVTITIGSDVVLTGDARLSDARTPLAHTHVKADVTDFAHTHSLDDTTAPTTSYSFNSQRLTSLGTPTADTDAATKIYVDNLASGIHAHEATQAATTDTLTVITGNTVTYDNGVLGVGATLTLSTALPTLDGITLTNGMRILIKNEATQAHNGIYSWATGGTVLTRTTDFDSDAEIDGGDYIFNVQGTVNENRGYVQIQAVTTVGTDSIVFQQFSGAGAITAGTGLTQTGTTINAIGTANRITANADSLDISSAYVGQTSITTLGTISTAVIPQSVVTNLTTDLGNKQPLDASLTEISGLTLSNDNIIQQKAGVLTNRTPAQFKNDLVLVKADVGLGNVADVLQYSASNRQTNIVNSEIDAAAGIEKTKISDTGTWEVAEIPTLTRAKISDFLPITKSDVSDTGTWEVAEIPNLPTSIITSGQFVIARLSSGTPDGTKYIRDDGVLTTPTASVNIKQTEVDFGTTPVSNATFSVTDVDVSTSNQLLAQVSWEAPTGKDLDEIEMDNLQIRCKPLTGSFDMYVESADGSYLADKFKINYLIG